jgi:hypothetical protein
MGREQWAAAHRQGPGAEPPDDGTLAGLDVEESMAAMALYVEAGVAACSSRFPEVDILID